MENSSFPTLSGTCTCQSGQLNYWDNDSEANNFAGLEDISHLSYPNTTSQAYADLQTCLPYPPLHLPLDPALWPNPDSESRLVADYPPQQSSEGCSDSASWIQRLEILERAVEQLQDPVKLQQNHQNWSRVDDLENSTERLQSEIEQHQQAIYNLESWAEMMKNAYKEFKGALCEVYKLVNSRKNVLGVGDSSKAAANQPSRKSPNTTFQRIAKSLEIGSFT